MRDAHLTKRNPNPICAAHFAATYYNVDFNWPTVTTVQMQMVAT